MPQFKLPAPDTESSSEQLPQPQQLELKPVRRYRLDSRRDEQEPWVDTEINDQAVVAVEMDDGFTLWLRGDDLRRELARPPARGSDSDAWELRRSLPVDNAERGIGEWALKALSIFDFKPPELAALALAKLAERNNGNILKHIAVPSPDDWTEVVTPIPAPANESGPLLLFLHGTFSSTEGSFGKLLANPGAWRSLLATYPGRIYGYEHRTVSESPIDNLLALLDKLPDGARLHLVSHSRGGLLGDLLALGSGAASFTDEQIGRFPESQQARLRKLGQQLATKQLHIERFVRVASPSRGTTLASGRLDRWLSVLSYLLSKVPVVGGTLGEGIQEFLLAVIQQRTNPETLPGLEAMMPGSALVGLLNGPVTAKLPGTLAVIAGDIEGAGLWGRLKLLLPDLFFDGQHDLVVNTGSMYGGPIREHGIHVFDQGADVDHFSYFQQRNAGDEVIAGLTRALPIPGFEPITADLATRPARGITPRDYPHQPRRPVLFVLPGIMGSALSVDNKEVWVNVGRLAFGGLGRLQLPPQAGGPAAASSVSATGMLDMAYGDLLEHFSRSHNIVPFPYDWRLSIEDSARLLAETLEPKLARAENDGQPLAILAHSMGGLVARAMIAARPDLWKRIRRHPQGRLVMLGTPNAGSWEIVRLLVGRSSTLKKLALLDLTNNGTELLDIISAFPGVLELLPDDDRELFTPAFWSGLHQQDQAERHLWSPPDHHDAGIHGPSRLAEAGAVRQRLRNNAIDPNGMVYVAGQAPVTPSDVQPTDVDQAFFGDSQTGLAFQASPRGDSQVLWDTGLLPGVPTWYMSGVVHGDLANHQDAFEALRELIDTGNTHALARQAPQTRGVAATFAMPEHEPAFLPDQRSLLSSALGMGPPPQRTRSDQKVRVYITHGDLKSGRHIVAVGQHHRRSRGLPGPGARRMHAAQPDTGPVSGRPRHPRCVLQSPPESPPQRRPGSRAGQGR